MRNGRQDSECVRPVSGGCCVPWRSVRARCAEGFTLIEISLAILLLATGLLVVFGLFPAGLSQGDYAYRDSQSALFADYVLSGLRANVEGIGVWSRWNDTTRFTTDALAGLGGVRTTTENSVAMEFPPGSGNWVRYMLELEQRGGQSQWHADLWVWGLRYGPRDAAQFKRYARRYHTAFYYTGGLP